MHAFFLIYSTCIYYLFIYSILFHFPLGVHKYDKLAMHDSDSDDSIEVLNTTSFITAARIPNAANASSNTNPSTQSQHHQNGSAAMISSPHSSASASPAGSAIGSARSRATMGAHTGFPNSHRQMNSRRPRTNEISRSHVGDNHVVPGESNGLDVRSELDVVDQGARADRYQETLEQLESGESDGEFDASESRPLTKC